MVLLLWWCAKIDLNLVDTCRTIFTRNNQPKIHGCDRGEPGKEIQRGGSVGKGDTIVFGAFELEEGKKLK
jgi:hypothetical protein